MTAAFIAEFLAYKGPIGHHMRRALIKGFKALGPEDKFQAFAEWYAVEPDAVERAIRDMPQREEFHNRLIADFARRQT